MGRDPEKERIGLLVEESIKDDWEEFIGDTYGHPKNFSELIRTATNNFVEQRRGDSDGSLPPSSGGDGSGLNADDRQKIERASEAATSIEGAMERLVARMSSIEETVEEQSRRREVTNHAAKILPTIQPTSREWTETDVWAPPTDVKSPGPPTSSETAEEARLRDETVRETTDGTPEQVGEHFGVDEITARAALEHLREELGFIERETFDGTAYYWRNEG